MVRCSEKVRIAVAEHTRKILALREKETALVRVDLEHLEDLHLRAMTVDNGKHEFDIDEPQERGGTDLAPAPLPFFLAGASSCFLMQCVKLTIVNQLALNDVKMSAIGRFDRRRGGGFEEIIYELRITGSEPREKVVEMVREAEKMCYASNTLKHSVKMRVRLWYNNEQLPLG
mgnify:CR=1 FL=1